MAKLKNSTKPPFYKTGPLHFHDKDHKNTSSPVTPTEKAKVGEIPGLEEIKERFKGKYTVTPKKGKFNEYTLTDKSGGSVSYSAGKKIKKDKRTLAQAINESIK